MNLVSLMEKEPATRGPQALPSTNAPARPLGAEIDGRGIAVAESVNRFISDACMTRLNSSHPVESEEHHQFASATVNAPTDARL